MDLSSKYGQLLQKEQAAEATGGLIGNKIADKITSVSKKSSTELHSNELQNNEANNETEALKKDRYLQKKDNKLLMI